VISRRTVLAAAALAPLAPGLAQADAAPVPPSLDDLLRPPLLRDAALSPDGRRVAMLAADRVLLFDADAPDAPPAALSLGALDQVRWANAERLLLWRTVGKGGQRRSEVSTVDLAGGDPRPLSPPPPLTDPALADPLPDEPGAVLMQAFDPDAVRLCLARVDLASGTWTRTEEGEATTLGWTIRAGAPVLRLDGAETDGGLRLFAKPPGAAGWTFLRETRLNDQGAKDFELAAMTGRPGVALVVHRGETDETCAVRRFDLRRGVFGQAVAQHPGRDVEAAFVDQRGRYVGARFRQDRGDYLFPDRSAAADFRALQAAAGPDLDVELLDAGPDGGVWLGLVRGPQAPGDHHLYHRASRRLSRLGAARPWLAPGSLARVEPLTVAARDGARLDAYLTRPLAPGPRPLAVLPHGGPELRDSLGFDLMAQALAAQGWLVLQVNFRGSGGYGRRFAEAGRRRWGGRMQEDVEDAVAQVVAAGRVAAGRIAICGASYGGYAALMGAVRRPELYRAVVSIAGPTDLIRLLDHARDAEGETSAAYGYLKATIGDPDTDREALAAASPHLHAEAVAAPVLLLHGRRDTVVPPGQSRMMAAALRKAGKTVAHSEFGAGHHGWDREVWGTILSRTIEHLRPALDG